MESSAKRLVVVDGSESVAAWRMRALAELDLAIDIERQGATFAVQDLESSRNFDNAFDRGFFETTQGVGAQETLEASGAAEQVAIGAPGDLTSLLVQALERHRELHGRGPEEVMIFSDFHKDLPSSATRWRTDFNRDPTQGHPGSRTAMEMIQAAKVVCVAPWDVGMDAAVAWAEDLARTCSTKVLARPLEGMAAEREAAALRGAVQVVTASRRGQSL